MAKGDFPGQVLSAVRMRTSGPDVSPAWSADGTRLVFTRYGSQNTPQLWVVDVDGGNPHQLRKGFIIEPTWSADGVKLAYAAKPTPQGYQVWTADADGSNATTLYTSFSDSAQSPDWSPDTAQVAFQSDRGIGVIGADGANPHFLSPSNLGASDPAFAPDGTRVAFAAYPNQSIDTMDTNGANVS